MLVLMKMFLMWLWIPKIKIVKAEVTNFGDRGGKRFFLKWEACVRPYISSQAQSAMVFLWIYILKFWAGVEAKWRPPCSLVLFHVDNCETWKTCLNRLAFVMTSTCWPWSTLEKACLKRAMALHRDSGRSEAACAKAELCSRISWQHGTLGGRPGPPFLPLIGWTKFYATFHWTSNSHLVMTAQCNSTLWLVT